MSDIQNQINQELENARAVCGIDASSPECASAWDAVEELQAEAAHQRQKHPNTTYFQEYCDSNPDAVECRVYED